MVRPDSFVGTLGLRLKYGDDSSSVDSGDRRIHRSQNERAMQLDVLQLVTFQLSLERLHVNYDVWQFRHGRCTA